MAVPAHVISVSDRAAAGVREDLSGPPAVERLRAAVGDTPLWIEKILMADEDLPGWPIEGTTGYESCAAITRASAQRPARAKA